MSLLEIAKLPTAENSAGWPLFMTDTSDTTESMGKYTSRQTSPSSCSTRPTGMDVDSRYGARRRKVSDETAARIRFCCGVCKVIMISPRKIRPVARWQSRHGGRRAAHGMQAGPQDLLPAVTPGRASARAMTQGLQQAGQRAGGIATHAGFTRAAAHPCASHAVPALLLPGTPLRVGIGRISWAGTQLVAWMPVAAASSRDPPPATGESPWKRPRSSRP